MKSLKIAFSVLALICTTMAYCQSAEDYAAFAEFLPAEKLSHLQNGQGDNYAKIAYLNRHGYHLAKTGEKDFSMYPDVSEVSAVYGEQPPITLDRIESGQLNLIAYNFKPKREKYSYYRLGQSDKVLVIPPTALTEKQRIQE